VRALIGWHSAGTIDDGLDFFEEGEMPPSPVPAPQPALEPPRASAALTRNTQQDKDATITFTDTTSGRQETVGFMKASRDQLRAWVTQMQGGRRCCLRNEHTLRNMVLQLLERERQDQEAPGTSYLWTVQF
jgi:hypothetical protein